jgi:hypothetical protein
VYCNEPGDFHDEHVFPAGLGGDNNLQLRDLVCYVCNHDVFGPLDQELMRSSAVAIMRQFRMGLGRHDGKRSAPPKLDTRVTELFHPILQLYVEEEVLPGGRPHTRPQILFNGQDHPLIGSDQAEIDAFVDRLASVLASTAQLIVKEGRGREAVFHVTTLTWDGQQYVQNGVSVEKRAPKTGIWLEPLEAKSEGNKDCYYASRLFHRREGQLVLRALPQNDVAVLLTEARLVASQTQQHPPMIPHDISAPSVNVSMSMDMFRVWRAMAKIAVNHVCHEYGDSIVRHPTFGMIKRQILLEGLPPIEPKRWDAPQIEEIFSKDTRPIHVVMLWPAQLEDGTFRVCCGIRFFQTPFEGFVLAEGVPLPADSAPVIYLVHYQEYRTERFDWREYLLHAIVVPMFRAQQSLPPQ